MSFSFALSFMLFVFQQFSEKQNIGPCGWTKFSGTAAMLNRWRTNNEETSKISSHHSCDNISSFCSTRAHPPGQREKLAAAKTPRGSQCHQSKKTELGHPKNSAERDDRESWIEDPEMLWDLSWNPSRSGLDRSLRSNCQFVKRWVLKTSEQKTVLRWKGQICSSGSWSNLFLDFIESNEFLPEPLRRLFMFVAISAYSAASIPAKESTPDSWVWAGAQGLRCPVMLGSILMISLSNLYVYCILVYIQVLLCQWVLFLQTPTNRSPWSGRRHGWSCQRQRWKWARRGFSGESFRSPTIQTNPYFQVVCSGMFQGFRRAFDFWLCSLVW